jgi:hypothetical protein
MVDSSFAPLLTPIHGPVPEGHPPWKDNAFLAFWDVNNDLFGSVHVSTSPNAWGRRARFSISLHGKVIEVIEDLASGTFTSESISFEMGAPITVRTPRLSGVIEEHPRFGLADYVTGSKVMPELVPGERLSHYQHATNVTGTLTVDGEQIKLTGAGFRDRTWGYRDESANMSEYLAVMIVAPEAAISGLRLRDTHGQEFTEGFVTRADGSATPIEEIAVTRDASSLCVGLALGLVGNSHLEARNIGRRGGFWAPMGWTRRGPSLGEFDEFAEFTVGDGTGGSAEAFGMIAHGIMRALY